jgi:phosphate uptake regulator
VSTIELARRVQEMRAAQQRYFANPNRDYLAESKRLERELDRLVKNILDDKAPMLSFGDDEP